MPSQTVRFISYGGRLIQYVLFHWDFVMLENKPTGSSLLNIVISEMCQMIYIPTFHSSGGGQNKGIESRQRDEL